MVVAKKSTRERPERYFMWTMAHRFRGAPKAMDIALEHRPVRPLQDGEFLVEAQYWSTDPFNRNYADAPDSDFEEGYCIKGFQVAKVIESRAIDRGYPLGALLVGQFGWRTHTILRALDGGGGATVTTCNYDDPPAILNFPPILLDRLPVDWLFVQPSWALGLFGMPGVAAFYAVLDVCQPKPKQTFLVNCATGAVGSIACQIAKIKGCRVIAVTSSNEKVEWLKKVAGIELAFNYNSTNLDTVIPEAAPGGIDHLLDLAGGKLAADLYAFLNRGAHVCHMGNTSLYNLSARANASTVFKMIIDKELQVKGFQVGNYGNRIKGAVGQLYKWHKEGKLHYHECVYDGFEKLPQTFVAQMEGTTTGKVIVKNDNRPIKMAP